VFTSAHCPCFLRLPFQEPEADQELREMRMRYTRERDIQNESLPNDSERFSLLPDRLHHILARTFGPRHVQRIFWLLILILGFMIIRLIFGSPLAYFGQLPADIRLKGPNWQFYAPFGTCIILSLLFSAFSRLLGPALARPQQYSQSHMHNISPARGGVQFHGSIVVCAIQ
jgi:hypothetical protein